MAVTPDGAYAYVTNQASRLTSVSTLVISTGTNTVTATVTGFKQPYGVAAAPNGAYVYVTDDGADSVLAINTATNTVTGMIPIGIDPSGVAITPNGEYAYVTHSGNSNTVSVINIGALTASVLPSSLAIDLGQSSTYTATAFGGSGSYKGYQWYVDGSAQSGQTASKFSFVPVSAGSYSITATVTDSSGAISTQSNAATITVNASPTVSIAPFGPLSLPEGQVQLFKATVSGGSGTINYQWYLDGSAVGTDSASYSYISAVGSHNVTCKVTDSAQIPVTSPASNTVSIKATPAVSGASAIDNSWTEKATIPSTTSGDGVTVVNGTIYIFGPIDYAYNPRNDTLTTIAPMLTPRVSFAVTACGNKIYVIGGFNEYSGSPYPVNEVYDPSTNTWTTAAPMPTSRGEMQANTINGLIYVMGGRGADTYSTNVNEIYHPATDSWSTGASMPYSAASAASAVVNNNIYIIGGGDDNHPPTGSQNVPGVNSVNFNQIYNPVTNSWSLGTPIPTSTLDAGAGATTGVMAPERIYVFGNIVGFLVSSNQNYAYDPAKNSWTSGAPMPYVGVSLAVAVVDDLVYVMGDGQNVEQYTPIGYSQPIVTATADSGATVDLAISGSITSSQMSSVTIVTNQSAKTTTLSFTLTGESGTTGFSNITIPKNAVTQGITPEIYIDGQSAQDQGFTKDINDYYVWYSTSFSTHEISIVFTASSSLSPEGTGFPWVLLEITLVVFIVIILSIVIFGWKRITGKNQLG